MPSPGTAAVSLLRVALPPVPTHPLQRETLSTARTTRYLPDHSKPGTELGNRTLAQHVTQHFKVKEKAVRNRQKLRHTLLMQSTQFNRSKPLILRFFQLKITGVAGPLQILSALEMYL